MGLHIRPDGLFLHRCHRRGARRATQYHIDGAGTLGDEVCARSDAAKHYHVQGVTVLAGLPQRGASVDIGRDRHVEQMAVGKVGHAGLKGVIHMAILVGCHLDDVGLVRHTNSNLLAVYFALLAEDGGHAAGIVDDVHTGIARNFREFLARVVVGIFLGHVDAHIIAVALTEDGVSEAVDAAVGGQREHL